jgi:hypothetical protein
MKNIIDALSQEARSKLDEFLGCNVGIIRSVPVPAIQKFVVCNIGVYSADTKFPTETVGVSLKTYQELQPTPEISYVVLVNGSTSDGGNLKGILKKYGTDGFLYKPFNETKYHNKNFIKYDYHDKLVKLIQPYSFLKGGGRKL